jgi:hypothetical protein
MRKMVSADVVAFGEVDDDSDEELSKPKYRLAAILKKKSNMRKLLLGDFDDDDNDDDEERDVEMGNHRKESSDFPLFLSPLPRVLGAEIASPSQQQRQNEKDKKKLRRHVLFDLSSSSEEDNDSSDIASREGSSDADDVVIRVVESTKQPKHDQSDQDLLFRKKRYTMFQTEKKVSMEYREMDARERLEARLKLRNEKRRGGANDYDEENDNSEFEEDAAGEVTKLSATSPGGAKDMKKRLQSNAARHRISISVAESKARVRLQNRLSSHQQSSNLT